MKSRSRVLAGSLIAAAIAITSCRSSDSTGPSADDGLDLSALISEMGIGGGNVATEAAAGGFVVPSASPIVPSSCQYSATTQGFVCPTLTSNGMTFSASFFLLDAAGHFQSQPAPNTTDAFRTVIDLSGTTSLDHAGTSGSATPGGTKNGGSMGTSPGGSGSMGSPGSSGGTKK